MCWPANWFWSMTNRLSENILFQDIGVDIKGLMTGILTKKFNPAQPVRLFGKTILSLVSFGTKFAFKYIVIDHRVNGIVLSC